MIAPQAGFRDSPSPTLCPICGDGSGQPRPLNRSGFLHCRVCDLVWTERRLEIPDLVEHYETREPSDAVRRARLALYDSFLRECGQQVGHRAGRLLDVGCGWGDFVERAARSGWDARGIEPSPRIADDASRRGLRVAPGTLEDLPVDWSCFDLITYWDVFMFVDHPHRELERAVARLRPGGSIYICTRQHAILRQYDRAWRSALRRLGLPNPVVYHPFNFAPRTIRRLGAVLGARRPLRIEIRPARLSKGDPYGSFSRDWPVRVLKGIVSGVAALGHMISGGRWILSPSMEVWIRPR